MRLLKWIQKKLYNPNPNELVCIWILTPTMLKTPALYADDEETLKLFVLQYGYVGTITQKTMSFLTYNYFKTLTFKATCKEGVYRFR